MYVECTCMDISQAKWKRLMKGAKPMNYNWLVHKIKKHFPFLYQDLGLEFDNPYADKCCKTKTHWILVHSSIEYFIRKK